MNLSKSLQRKKWIIDHHGKFNMESATILVIISAVLVALMVLEIIRRDIVHKGEMLLIESRLYNKIIRVQDNLDDARSSFRDSIQNIEKQSNPNQDTDYKEIKTLVEELKIKTKKIEDQLKLIFET